MHSSSSINYSSSLTAQRVHARQRMPWMPNCSKVRNPAKYTQLFWQFLHNNTVELRVQSLRTASTARAAAIHDANSALEHQRAAFSHTLPDATRSRQLEYRILAEQLARSQQATYVMP